MRDAPPPFNREPYNRTDSTFQADLNGYHMTVTSRLINSYGLHVFHDKEHEMNLIIKASYDMKVSAWACAFCIAQRVAVSLNSAIGRKVDEMMRLEKDHEENQN